MTKASWICRVQLQAVLLEYAFAYAAIEPHDGATTPTAFVVRS